MGELANQFETFWLLFTVTPVPILLLLVALLAGAWKINQWYYTRNIDVLNERIRLRDDEISHMKQSTAIIETRALRDDGDRASPQPEAPEQRHFVGEEVTVEYLMSLYFGKTALQGDKISAYYLGKWIEISGCVEFMDGMNSGVSATIRVTTNSEERSSSAYLVFSNDRDRLLAVPLNGFLRAAGKIRKVSHNFISLEECILL